MTSFGPRWSGGLSVATMAVGLGFLLSGCGGEEAAQTEDKIALLSTDIPLREPVWVDKPNFAIALREDRPQVVKFNASAGAPGEGDLGPGALDSSGELEGAGEDMALNHLKEDQAYLSQPNLARVALVDTTNLREMRSFDVGGDPEWVAVHPGSQTLFALSGDGSTLSEVDLKDPKKAFDFEVNAGEEAKIDTPERGLEPEFWI